MTNTRTPREFTHFKTLTPAAGRARVPSDTLAYLTSLELAARLADTEYALTAAGSGMRSSLTPPRPGHATDNSMRAALSHPPTVVHEALAALDTERITATARLATFAAQDYAAGALLILQGMLTGSEQLTPVAVETFLATRNATRPTARDEVALPLWAPHNRPDLPDLPDLATGHNDLDVAACGAYLDLARIYDAAERLEADTRNRAAGNPFEGGGQLTETAAADAVRLVAKLHTALINLGDLIGDSARYGHGDPAAAPAGPADA